MAKFKTRARTVDMLGRQQIANIATAINEILKNAYDAYASELHVDFVSKYNMMVIRDNGVGMTPDEFQNRWLVLGTDSKYDSENKRDLYKPHNEPERIIMGEKGIGRLAISLLGKQVLILTRANRDKRAFELQMCFIHWKLFEVSGLNLEEIEIPTKLISGENLPTDNDVLELLEEMRVFVKKLMKEKLNPVLREVLNDLNTIKFDSKFFNENFGEPNLLGKNSGTQFYIFNPNAEIVEDFENNKKENFNEILKIFISFFNSTFCETKKSILKTEFKYWTTDNDVIDLRSERDYFTHDELELADHRFKGKFDEYGQFLGDVKIYDNVISNHVIQWLGGKGKKTDCGPFEVELGYVGSRKYTKLTPDQWTELTSKTNEIGGLYVYKDNVRILPYGSTELDWLKIDERKTRKASYYFFSYNQMFGAVILTQKQNKKLQEKAGREGFQQNKAYRQLQDILINFFIQLARDFFREDGELTYFYEDERVELDKIAEARKKREKEADKKRKNVAVSLDNCFDRMNSDMLTNELNELRTNFQKNLQKIAINSDMESRYDELLEAESETISKLSNIKDGFKLSKPRGLGLPKEILRDWSLYKSEFMRIESEVLDPFSVEIKLLTKTYAKKLGIVIDQKKIKFNQISAYGKEQLSQLNNLSEEIEDAAIDLLTHSRNITKKSIDEFKDVIIEAEEDFIVNLNSEQSEEKQDKNLVKKEHKIKITGDKIRNKLECIKELLIEMTLEYNEGLSIMNSDSLEAMDQELLNLREKANEDADMVQLGVAIAVINHEFEIAIGRVRYSLTKLRKLGKNSDQLLKLYEEIQSNFDHIDGHLYLFTPLQRRQYKRRISITGAMINHYIGELFDNRLDRHGIKLTATDNFLKASVDTHTSTIYPVFINLIDNAVFWLMSNQGEKTITLDATESSFLISNNGPIISNRDYISVFERGFTRKPSGRGLGLYISKRTLEQDSLSISIVPTSKKVGVQFKISWETRHENKE